MVTNVAAMDPHSLLLVGDGPVVKALAPMAELLGWHPRVVATVDDAAAALPSAHAVVVTSHDPDVDAPTLAAAIAARPVYIGAMGSRGRQARRREWLVAHGATEADLALVHGPAGLDIGANSPAEIALAILAELVATVRGA